MFSDNEFEKINKELLEVMDRKDKKYKNIKNLIDNMKSSKEKDKLLEILFNEQERILFDEFNNKSSKEQLVEKTKSIHNDLLKECKKHKENKEFIKYLGENNKDYWDILEYLKAKYSINEEIIQYIKDLVYNYIDYKIEKYENSLGLNRYKVQELKKEQKKKETKELEKKLKDLKNKSFS